jgi:F-type H+-transporting ATPase subunit gamma
MANLKEIRNRITSVSSTMQITSAMKMVSAAKLKRAQDRIVQLRPYAEKLQEILEGLSSSLDMSENDYATERETQKVLFVAVASNRGLAGAFNNNIVKEIKRLMVTDYNGCESSIISIGKKTRDAFKSSNLSVEQELGFEDLDAIYNDLSFDKVSPIADVLMSSFVSERFDKIVVIYNKFKNAATQEVQAEQFLPIEPIESEGNSQLDYIFEPSKEEVVTDMIPKSLKIQLYKAILDSNASEHGARMTAMHKATDNATELRNDLKLFYNKARQAAITNEILEITAGANALEG